MAIPTWLRDCPGCNYCTGDDLAIHVLEKHPVFAETTLKMYRIGAAIDSYGTEKAAGLSHKGIVK